MSDGLLLFLSIILVVVLILFVCIFFVYLLCGVEAFEINKKYGTNYTASDIFWFGDKIIVDNKVELKK